MKTTRVLFVCIHNSARSQMAEALLNTLGGGKFAAWSAGIEPGKLNPLAVLAMKEIGIDISGNAVKGVADIQREGREFDYVITLCDETSGERCPLFPGTALRLHWGFDDPSALHGDFEEKLKKTGIIRDRIRERVERFVRETR